MRGILGMLAAGAVAASVSLAAAEAAAVPVQIDFTVDYSIASDTFGSPTGPFGTPPHDSTSPFPTFAGSFVFDDTGLGPLSSVLFSDFVTGLSFQTGSVSWSIADIALPPATIINNLVFDSAGLLDVFRFELRRPGVGSVIVASNDTMNLRTADFLLSSACNDCVSFAVSAPAAVVPEPTALSLTVTGLGLLGLMRRFRRRHASR